MISQSLSLIFKSSSCLVQVLFLGPLMQQAMDCPWSLIDGIRVAFGKTAIWP